MTQLSESANVLGAHALAQLRLCLSMLDQIGASIPAAHVDRALASLTEDLEIEAVLRDVPRDLAGLIEWMSQQKH